MFLREVGFERNVHHKSLGLKSVHWSTERTTETRIQLLRKKPRHICRPCCHHPATYISTSLKVTWNYRTKRHTLVLLTVNKHFPQPHHHLQPHERCLQSGIAWPPPWKSCPKIVLVRRWWWREWATVFCEDIHPSRSHWMFQGHFEHHWECHGQEFQAITL
jgi:hypothetical protein